MAEKQKIKKAYIIRTNGNKTDLDHRPTLAETQQVVGGYIELVPLLKDKTMVVNEDGRRMGLPVNSMATQLYRHCPILGDVIVLEGWKTVGVINRGGST